MNEQLRRGVESSPSVGVNGKKSNYLVGKLKRVASSVAAVLAFVGGVNEAKAETETVDDMIFDKDLGQYNSSLVVLPDLVNSSFSLEKGLANGGKVELDSNYYATASSDYRTLEIREASNNNIIESVTFSNNLTASNEVVSLGRGYFMTKAGSDVRVFDISEVGTQNFQFRAQPTSSYGLPVYLNKHPQSNDVVGVTLYSSFNEALFFSYVTGNFTSVHPIQDSNLKAVQALRNIGLIGSNNLLNANTIGAGVFGEDVYFAFDENGDVVQWKNQESDEAATPNPVISAPESFSLNVADVLIGKKLEVTVSNVPENGSVVLQLAGESFVMINAGGDNYELVLTQSELEAIQGGEFSEVAIVRVLDEAGQQVGDEAEVNSSVDVVNPDVVQFEVEGAEIVSMGGVDIYSLESEEIPADITLVWEDGALMNLAAANVAVASIPLPPGTSMADFVAQSDQDKIDFVMGNVNITSGEEGGVLPKSGTLGTVKSIDDLSATSVAVEVSEGPHAVAILGTDAAGNLSVSIRVVDVNQVDNNDMTCEENPDQDKCETPVETCETNPELPECEVPVEETCETNPNLAECETPIVEPEPEPTPDSGVDGGNDGDSGSDEEGGGCSTSGTGDAPVDGGLALGALGMLGLAGMKKRKREIPKSKK